MIITSSQTSLIPTRDKFLNPELVAGTAATIAAGRPILFMVNDLFESKPYEDYCIYASGVFVCGTRALIRLDGIKIYTDVMVEGDVTAMKMHIAGLLASSGAPPPYAPEVIHLKRFDKFEEHPRIWLRYYFRSLKDRRSFISTVSRTQIVCGSNDSDYLHLVTRTWNFSTADWANVKRYRAMDVTTVPGLNPNVKYFLQVSIADFTRLTKADKLEMRNSPLSDHYDKDHSMVCSWDIETYFQHESGRPPRKEDAGWKIHMVCMSFFWHWSDRPLIEICVTDRAMAQSDPARDIDLVIVCRSPADLIATCCYIWGAMGPEILSAYNGIGFDMPLVSELAAQTDVEGKNNLILMFEKLSVLSHRTTKENILKWNFINERPVKVGADNNLTITRSSTFPGVIDTDVMISFMKLNSKGEVSMTKGLNFFLAENGLPSKEDMEYKTMFRIFERSYELEKANAACHCDELHADEYNRMKDPRDPYKANCAACASYLAEIDGPQPLTGCCACSKRQRCLELMFDVAYYCKIDCLRPQQLCVKRSVFADKRALANMARVRVWTAYYQADGMKVQNLIGKYAHKFGYAFHNGRVDKSDHDKDHNPGAHVFNPKLGLHRWVPIFAVDASSLYPSIMMEFNLSPDKIVEDEDVARELAARGYLLHQIGPIRYERGEKKGAAGNSWHVIKAWSVRHGGIKRADKSKRIVVAYEKTEAATVSQSETATASQSETAMAKTVWYPKDTRSGFTITGEPLGPSMEETMRCDCNEVLNVLPGPIRDEMHPCCRGHSRGYMHPVNFAGNPTRKVSYREVHGREALPGEVMGVLPYICSMLFNKRVPVKYEWNRWKQIVEAMKKDGRTTYEEKLPNGTMKTYTLADAIFNINKYDSTQKAIKILNNTFYGQSANFRSPTYKFAVGSGITSAGQTTIKRVADRIHKLGGIVWYGDTDSAYNSAPITLLAPAYVKYAAALDAAIPQGVARPPPVTPEMDFDTLTRVTQEWARFPIGPAQIPLRVALWEEMVRASMNYARVLCEDLGDMLMLENGGRFLQFAYEEVGMPTMLLGKKKYAMCAHIKEIKFDITKDIGAEGLFVKGLDIVKQGVTSIAREMGVDLVHEALSPYNELSLLELAEKYLIKFMESDLDARVLAKMQKYRPDRKNVAIHTFVRRMERAHEQYAADPYMRSLYEPPEPGDKFASVVVESTENFELNGNIKHSSIGEKTEYLHVYLESQKWARPFKLDRMYYLEKSILKLLTRFIHYPDEFQPPAGQFDLNTQYDQYDNYVGTQAKKYLLKVAARFLPNYNLATIAREHKRAYKTMTTRAAVAVTSALPCARMLQVNTERAGAESLITALVEERGRIVLAEQYIRDYTRAVLRGMKWGDAQRAYSYYVAVRPRRRPIVLIRKDYCDRALARITESINEVAGVVAIMRADYKTRLESLIIDQRRTGQIDHTLIDGIVDFTDEQKSALERLNALVDRLVAIKFVAAYNRELTRAVTAARAYASEPQYTAGDNYSAARAIVAPE